MKPNLSWGRFFLFSSNQFLIVALIAALLLLAISVTFVRELKLLLKEMISTIKVIASGDFTSVIDCSPNTEFGDALEVIVTLTSGVNSVAGSIGNRASTSNGQLEGLIISLNNLSKYFEGVIDRIKQLEE